ncbi:amino acid ABC transporter ATP-binding/permease protein [Corynebacterium mendelii]|uniref:ABC transporter ATP-binding protein n=1 Tax=Corynebacterium mendelii TaxID=2765362 RepID=A0A939DXY8_9CORY|nr:ABC transporter ATP-binding protein [Corynebacterium mendelii]MBN9643285.1 ABC transporter ATP-binding protein [Corynebacterium mendelii]
MTSAASTQVTAAANTRAAHSTLPDDTPSRRELTRWLFTQVGSLVWPLGISVVARVLGQILTITLLVVAVTTVVNAAIGYKTSLHIILPVMAAIAIIKALLRYVEHYTGHLVAFSALHKLRVNFFGHLVPQAPAATQGKAGAEFAQRATGDIDRIEVFFAHTFPPAVSAILVPLITLLWLGTTAGWAVAAALVPATVILVVVLPLLSMKTSWKGARAIAADRGKLATHLTDDVQGIKEILAFDLNKQRLAGVAELGGSLTASRMTAAKTQGMKNGLQMLLQTANVIAVVAVASATGAPPQSMAIAVAVSVALWGPINGIDDFASGLDAAFAATARIHQIITATPKVLPPAHPEPVPAENSIRLESVDFSYNGTRKVLDAVSLTAPDGQWTYLVGVSGSGKSTVAAMVLRGWDPDHGTVTIGTTPVNKLALTDLRRKVAVASQRDTMLSGTIRENLSLRKPDATDGELLQALTAADLRTWVESTDQGLDTEISERGSSLSGGQLQRLALARALAGQPDILIIDEALSQLDEITANTVRSRIKQLGITVLEITHRVDAIDDNSNVVVIDAGKIVETGSAGDLRATADSMLNRIEQRVS